MYETNFHKIALYPPWAAATVPRLQNAAPTIAAARQYLLISHKISHTRYERPLLGCTVQLLLEKKEKVAEDKVKVWSG